MQKLLDHGVTFFFKVVPISLNDEVVFVVGHRRLNCQNWRLLVLFLEYVLSNEVSFLRIGLSTLMGHEVVRV